MCVRREKRKGNQKMHAKLTDVLITPSSQAAIILGYPSKPSLSNQKPPLTRDAFARWSSSDPMHSVRTKLARRNDLPIAKRLSFQTEYLHNSLYGARTASCIPTCDCLLARLHNIPCLACYAWGSDENGIEKAKPVGKRGINSGGKGGGRLCG